MKVKRSLPCFWRLFCEWKPGSDCCDVLISFLTFPESQSKPRLELWMAVMFWNNQEAKFWFFWDGDWWRLCYSLKIEVGTTFKCISESVWVIWLGNAQGRLELGCKNQKLAGFVFLCFQFQVLWNFSKVSKPFRKFSTSLQLPMKFNL